MKKLSALLVFVASRSALPQQSDLSPADEAQPGATSR